MYKINLHITQKCNYSCKYCFAHFHTSEDLPIADWKKIVDNIQASNLINEINFAGGEPVLYKDFPELIEYAYNKGFKLSLITNGSLISQKNFSPSELFSKFDMLGISIDSFSKNILQELGACTNKGEVLSYEDFQNIINKAKEINPQIKIKINTVISSINAKDNIILPKGLVNRWKFLKMKEFKNNNFNNKQLVISSQEFKNIINRYQKEFPDIIIPEESLSQSYIIIDNQGNLLDNKEDNYTIVGNLLTEDFKEIFNKFSFNQELYKQRY